MRFHDEYARSAIPDQRRTPDVDDPHEAALPATRAAARGQMPVTAAMVVAMQRSAGNAAAAALMAQRSIAGVQPVVVQRQWTSGTMSGDDPVYAPNGGRAGTVEVHNLEGQPLGAGANAPSVKPLGWDKILGEGFGLGGQMPAGAHYNAVRMHLWNGRLGGPGNDLRNLAPGAGQVNSEMSASAEMPVKNLVTAGEKVWLRTGVTYQTSPANANDLTSIIPNHIQVDWGVENKPATARAWSSDIYFPVDPLNPAQQAVYQAWPAGPAGAAALIDDLRPKNGQIQAQALTLLPSLDLKQAVYQAFPGLFLGLGAADQSAFYQLLHGAGGEAQIAAFANHIGKTDDAMVSYVVLPLYRAGMGGNAALCQIAERQFAAHIPDVARQRRQLIIYKQELMGPAGAAATALAKVDYTIFCYLGGAERVALITALIAANEIRKFLENVCGSTTIADQVLDAWARAMVGDDNAARQGRVTGTPQIPQRYRDHYAATLATQQASQQYLGQRPKRAVKVPPRYFPY